ncbi:MAG: uncharacterized protein QOG89_3784 [Thermomicrobiales bacterium]|nr:uncharacterized protein [Thermomicrobiales bacterium]
MTSSRLSQFREHKDHYFSHGDHSPLSADQRERFAGLAYFDEDPALSFTVAPKTDGPGIGERVELETTDGTTMRFVRAALVTVPIIGQPVELSVLKDLDRGRYFLPFRDTTAGEETYQLGRYLDPRERPDGTLVVDFNYAYNPYCAYGDGWSCPIPPEENVVPVRIEAGERSFGASGEESGAVE